MIVIKMFRLHGKDQLYTNVLLFPFLVTWINLQRSKKPI